MLGCSCSFCPPIRVLQESTSGCSSVPERIYLQTYGSYRKAHAFSSLPSSLTSACSYPRRNRKQLGIVDAPDNQATTQTPIRAVSSSHKTTPHSRASPMPRQRTLPAPQEHGLLSHRTRCIERSTNPKHVDQLRLAAPSRRAYDGTTLPSAAPCQPAQVPVAACEQAT